MSVGNLASSFVINHCEKMFLYFQPECV